MPVRALAIVLLMTATAVAGNVGKSAAARKQPPAAASTCDKTYSHQFTITRGAGKVQLRLVKLPPPRTPAGRPAPTSGGQVFEDATMIYQCAANCTSSIQTCVENNISGAQTFLSSVGPCISSNCAAQCMQ